MQCVIDGVVIDDADEGSAWFEVRVYARVRKDVLDGAAGDMTLTALLALREAVSGELAEVLKATHEGARVA